MFTSLNITKINLIQQRILMQIVSLKFATEFLIWSEPSTVFTIARLSFSVWFFQYAQAICLYSESFDWMKILSRNSFLLRHDKCEFKITSLRKECRTKMSICYTVCRVFNVPKLNGVLEDRELWSQNVAYWW